MTIYHNPFDVDWYDLDQVIAYAKDLGPGNIVVKYPDRPNYNITHPRRDGYAPVPYEVIWEGD